MHDVTVLLLPCQSDLARPCHVLRESIRCHFGLHEFLGWKRAQAGCFPRPQPDLDAFNAIVADLAALRTKLSEGQLGTNKVTTSGIPLGIHPGLADATTESNVRQEIKSFLAEELSGNRRDTAH